MNADQQQGVAPQVEKIVVDSDLLQMEHLLPYLCDAPCGFFGDSTRQCHCSPPQIQRYVSKISGPLIDRIDIHIEVPAVKYKELRATGAIEDSATVRERVLRARSRQTARYAGEKKIFSIAQMPPKLIR